MTQSSEVDFLPEGADDVDADAEREVRLVDDLDLEVLPDQSSDDRPDWSELREDDHEVRLFEERPPHYQ